MQKPPKKKKVEAMRRGPIAEIWDKVQALWKLIQDPKAAVPHKIAAIGALLYLVSPIDAVPDAIPIAGLTDDVGVIMGVVGMLGTELGKYIKKNKGKEL